MNSERWHQIERIYHAALERPPRERGAFLEGECRGDDDLRLEVQSLLKRPMSAENSVDRPASAVAAPVMGEPGVPILTGLRFGEYVVQGPLGAGGMGVVYRALDTNLNRPVAIKFLFDELADPAARRRFQREAQTASSLNHPHILTVHDAGELDGRQYLVTEFVDGGTLRDWIRAAKRGWRQTIELLTGVADGLGAAHQAGILHRDIKPENILITKSGYAKFADFGLAKLHDSATPDDAARTGTATRTRPGIILGTVAYMSPEQASGQPLDARSDIFSFGVVLYEALAGRRPFTGASDLDLLHAIVHAPAGPLPEDVPLPLRMVVEKALEKDPADRFQSMRDLVVDLRRLVRQSAEVPAQSVPARRTTRARIWVMAVAAPAVLLAAAGALVVSRLRQPAAPARLEYTPLTNFADSATSPALSPDGRMLAFIRGEATFSGPGQIYVKLLPDGDPVQLTHDNLKKMGPKFSPDGTRITYSTDEGSKWNTWIVPALGGEPRIFQANAGGLTWIDAGAGQVRFLFSEMTGRGMQMAIATSTQSRAEPRTVYMPPAVSGMAHRSYLSPDREHVLLVEMSFGTWLPCRLTPFGGSSPGKPVGPVPAQCTDASWSPDGKWMYFSANTGNGYHIWRQRFPDGAPEQVTSGVTEEAGIEFAPDGRSFVTSIGTAQSTIWVHDSSGDRQITSEGYGILPSISSDGKNLYYLLRAGGARNIVSGELWVADLESGQRQRLLPDFLMRDYAISRDGQRVVSVVADATGRSPVWLTPLDRRSAPRRLTAYDARKAFFGAAGDVVFLGEDQGTNVTYRVKEDGSELPELMPTPDYLGRQLFLALSGFGVSPDGKWVVAITGTSEDMLDMVMVYPVGGGSPTLICEKCAQAGLRTFERGPGPPLVDWSPDGKFLYLNFKMSIYAIPLRSGQVLPAIPASGFRTVQEVTALPGARLIPQEGAFAGPNPSIYAFTKFATQRNIYRVPVP